MQQVGRGRNIEREQMQQPKLLIMVIITDRLQMSLQIYPITGVLPKNFINFSKKLRSYPCAGVG